MFNFFINIKRFNNGKYEHLRLIKSMVIRCYMGFSLKIRLITNLFNPLQLSLSTINLIIHLKWLLKLKLKLIIILFINRKIL